MAESQPGSRSNTPLTVLPMKRQLEEDHAPAVSSPLNPNPEAASRARSRPPPREQREKRETLKKREAASQTHTRGNTPNPRTTSKKDVVSADHPMRYAIPEPKPADCDAPKHCILASHEPDPFVTPDGVELRKPVDHAWNKKGYRYSHCVADPMFRHKQYFRQSEVPPYGPRMSYEDTDRMLHFDDTATMVTNEKGWRMARGNVVAREGRMYYEVKIIQGIPNDGPKIKVDARTGNVLPGPHIRMGWARREAPLDAPVGFDSYSYGISDTRFEAMHRSRASKLFKPLPKGAKSKHMKARPPHGRSMPIEYIMDQEICEGDVIGLEIQLPSLSLHRKVVEGIYNPAVDIGDGFDPPAVKDQWSQEKPFDIIRDRIPVPYKGNFYFEQLDFVCSKAVEGYHERIPMPKITPSPNHSEVSLRSLPYSCIKVYKNGKVMGIANEELLAFLPPASQPSAEAIKAGARVGYDDGMVGYFPAVSVYHEGIAQVNFGPDFWYPPEELVKQREKDAQLAGAAKAEADIPQGRKLRAIGERYKEQIAEDVTWDIIDEVDFFSQDGGWEYKGEKLDSVAKSTPKARGFVNPDENLGVEVGRRY